MNKDSGLKPALIVIPTYNNAATIAAVIDETLQYDWPVLVVNDGSTDGSAAIVDRFGERIAKIHLEFNQGKGAALKTAIRYAKAKRFQTIICMDADGQHFPRDIAVFAEQIKDGVNQLIIGSRDFQQDSIPKSSRFGRHFSNFWIWLETGCQLSDTQSGFRLVTVTDLQLERLHCNSYDFEIEMISRLLWQGFAVSEVPIGVYYPSPDERVSHFRLYLDNFRLTKIHTRLVITSLFKRLFELRWRLHGPPSRQERGGIGAMRYAIDILGPQVSSLLMIFPLLYFFLTSSEHRRGIVSLYQRLHTHSKLRQLFSAFKNYWMFGCTLVDRFSYEAVEIVKSAHHQEFGFKPGCIYVGSHYGDWLISSRGLNHSRSIPVAIVIDQSVTPKFIEQVKASSPNISFIDPLQDGMAAMLAMKRQIDQGGCLCFLGDRPSPTHKNITLNFLGATADFPLAPYQIARALGSPILFFWCIRIKAFGKPRYQIQAVDLWDGHDASAAEAIATRYGTRLEAIVRDDPKHWFNFYDFWKKSHG